MSKKFLPKDLREIRASGLPVYMTEICGKSAEAYQVRFFCPFCVKWHRHGLPKNTRPFSIAHRLAHCGASGHHAGGYYIVFMPKGFNPDNYIAPSASGYITRNRLKVDCLDSVNT